MRSTLLSCLRASQHKTKSRGRRPLRMEPLESRQMLSVTLAPMATYQSGVFDEAAVEVSAYDPATMQIFATNAFDHAIDVLDVSGLMAPADPTALPQINDKPNDLPAIPKTDSLSLEGIEGEPTGVAVKDGLVATVLRNGTKKGTVVFFDTSGDLIGTIKVGAGPDMATFTPDGSKLLVANEGRPNDADTANPEGSVSIIDVSSILAEGIPDDPGSLVTTVKFNKFNGKADQLLEDGVRLFGPHATVAKDLEPEYIAVSEDGSTAFISLQDNNAIATLDIEAGKFTQIKGLGYQNYFTEDGLDASNKDEEINITNWPVKGIYMPDGISTYTVGDELYVLTANEGSDRDGDRLSEEVRVGDLTLGEELLAWRPEGYTEGEEPYDLQAKANLGRLKVTSAPPSGKTVVDGEEVYNELYAFGGRSFSIWNADTIEQVYDSGADFEEITAALDQAAQDDPDNNPPFHFNPGNDENARDSRSDDRGPEPSSVVTGEINGVTYAFTALERTGGIMVYDVTDPAAVSFVTYANNRDFTVPDEIEVPVFDENGDPVYEVDENGELIVDENGDPIQVMEEIANPDFAADVGDLHLESLEFIPAEDSPTGDPLVVASNEVSGSITVYVVGIPGGDGGETPGKSLGLASIDLSGLAESDLASERPGRKSGKNPAAAVVDLLMTL